MTKKIGFYPIRMFGLASWHRFGPVFSVVASLINLKFPAKSLSHNLNANCTELRLQTESKLSLMCQTDCDAEKIASCVNKLIHGPQEFVQLSAFRSLVFWFAKILWLYRSSSGSLRTWRNSLVLKPDQWQNWASKKSTIMHQIKMVKSHFVTPKVSWLTIITLFWFSLSVVFKKFAKNITELREKLDPYPGRRKICKVIAQFSSVFWKKWMNLATFSSFALNRRQLGKEFR
jgi:hypothetical protein